tara:strand:+ start:204 stop:635 length:432 start_codon:yes stop_codon:yes gene_type:complete
MPITNTKRSFCILSNKQFEKEFPAFNSNITANSSKQKNNNSVSWSDIIQNKKPVPSVSYDIKGLKDLPMKYNDDIVCKFVKHTIIQDSPNLETTDVCQDYIEYDMTYSDKFYLGCDEYTTYSECEYDDLSFDSDSDIGYEGDY